ncbi:MAG: FdtA/QdtA family cupin domain-containing protein [Algoriphagus sp.]|nr:FdtA/QdtA family cupin domain-containing protein [Algoriphagus sp.]
MEYPDFTQKISVDYPFRLDIPGVISQHGSVHFWEDRSLFRNGIHRCFWITGVADGDVRGSHAHWRECQVLVAIAGKVIVNVLSVDGKTHLFSLDKPSEGIYIPPLNWVEVVCTDGSVVLGLSDREFSEEDYIRDKDYFERLRENVR